MRKTVLQLVACFVLMSGQLVCASESGSIQYLDSGKIFPSGFPLSEAVRVGNLLYLSGQVGIVPGTMELASGGIKEETRQTMENIRVSLEAHGYQLNDLVQCKVMLADISEWSTFNEVYRTFFVDRFPARSAFGTSGLALDARVEIECIAALDE